MAIIFSCFTQKGNQGFIDGDTHKCIKSTSVYFQNYVARSKACLPASIVNAFANLLAWSSSKSPLFGIDYDLLPRLIKLVEENGKPSLQEYAARAVQNLAVSEDESLRERTGSPNKAIPGLIQLFNQHGKPSLQTPAACALRDLANSDEIPVKFRIAN
jgi:hypothetical protein